MSTASHVGNCQAVWPRRLVTSLLPMLSILTGLPLMAMAGGGGFGKPSTLVGAGEPLVPLSRKEAITLGSIFLSLFTLLAMLHAAEIAITTLYPWKVREIAEEEEKANNAADGGGVSTGAAGISVGKLKRKRRGGVFTTLNEDITSVLTTILVTSTACSIFATTLFTHLVASLFGTRGER